MMWSTNDACLPLKWPESVARGTKAAAKVASSESTPGPTASCVRRIPSVLRTPASGTQTRLRRAQKSRAPSSFLCKQESRGLAENTVCRCGSGLDPCFRRGDGGNRALWILRTGWKTCPPLPKQNMSKDAHATSKTNQSGIFSTAPVL